MSILEEIKNLLKKNIDKNFIESLKKKKKCTNAERIYIKK